MIRIAIVDDEKEQVVMLSTCVSVFFQERNLEYRIFPFFCDIDQRNPLIPGTQSLRGFNPINAIHLNIQKCDIDRDIT